MENRKLAATGPLTLMQLRIVVVSVMAMVHSAKQQLVFTTKMRDLVIAKLSWYHRALGISKSRNWAIAKTTLVLVCQIQRNIILMENGACHVQEETTVLVLWNTNRKLMFRFHWTGRSPLLESTMWLVHLHCTRGIMTKRRSGYRDQLRRTSLFMLVIYLFFLISLTAQKL